MAFIPPELIGLIVAEIDDSLSLKACALTATIFREPSQRILLRSFSLTTIADLQFTRAKSDFTRMSSDFAGVSTLLEQSPHVAAYITLLEVAIHAWDTSVIEALPRIFSKLMNVRQCTIGGLQFFNTEYYTPAFASALFNFLVRQLLHDLDATVIFNVSPAVILRLL
ncbi:hypothetical protein K438DRAFT_606564 [Mycena galopus ATCC 62051]|nr:hypothetical protein K438DRAFT_606564 [Mycena galopus ATCC 62051]